MINRYFVFFFCYKLSHIVANCMELKQKPQVQSSQSVVFLKAELSGELSRCLMNVLNLLPLMDLCVSQESLRISTQCETLVALSFPVSCI